MTTYPIFNQLGQFILASGSPRRKQLLEEQGCSPRVVVSDVAEPDGGSFTDPELYTMHVAQLKALAVARLHPNELVLAADTATAVRLTNPSQQPATSAPVNTYGQTLPPAEILGKADDAHHARQILSKLMGTTHETWTGVCLILPQSKLHITFAECSLVAMKQLTAEQLDRYIASNNWVGKAGAYGIQDDGDPFLDIVSGSVTNVIGLPIERLANVLEQVLRLEHS